MKRIVIPNKVDHYEFPGIEINVFPDKIVITSIGSPGGEDMRSDGPSSPPTDYDDGNMSLLASVTRIADRFSKKR
jgi:hypothetical protein